MTPEQDRHQRDNGNAFIEQYSEKYTNGQKHHGGNMWTMGAYQALANMEEEVLDQWSYARQIRKCLDEIREVCKEYQNYTYEDGLSGEIEEILNRIKED